MQQDAIADTSAYGHIRDVSNTNRRVHCVKIGLSIALLSGRACLTTDLSERLRFFPPLIPYLRQSTTSKAWNRRTTRLAKTLSDLILSMVGADIVKKLKRKKMGDTVALTDKVVVSFDESSHRRTCHVDEAQLAEGMSGTTRRKKQKRAREAIAKGMKIAQGPRTKNEIGRKSKKIPKVSFEPIAGVLDTGDTSATTAPQTCTTKVAEYETRDDDDLPHTLGKIHKRSRQKGTPSSKISSSGKNSFYNNRPKSTKSKALEEHHDQTETEAPLEGIMHEGTMYLVDENMKVFSSTRDSHGCLVQVGKLDKTGAGVTFAGTDREEDGSSAACTSESTSGAVLYAASADGDNVKKDLGDTRRKQRRRRKKKRKRDGKHENGAEDGTVLAATDEKGNNTKESTTDSTSPRVERMEYPFEVEDCDHCETSEQAYGDIAPVLVALAKELGKRPSELIIYDPYYCQGSSAKKLASVGFLGVYNRNEDFYKVWREGRVPEHDVVVTNPPFSGDHLPSILRFCSRPSRKPWLLLLPNFVYLKDYYEVSLSGPSDGRPLVPFFLTPPKRYSFYSPQGSRVDVKSRERKTSPFNTFWYVYIGGEALTSKVLRAYNAASLKRDPAERCCLARTPTQVFCPWNERRYTFRTHFEEFQAANWTDVSIPYKMMDSNDPRRKKARDRQRSIERIRKLKSS